MIIKLIGGIATLICAGGAVACAVPESREWLLDKVAPHSNVYKLKDEEVKNLTLENQSKQKTIDLLNKEIETKNARILEIENLLAAANTNLTLKDEEIALLKAEKSELQDRINDLQNQVNTLSSSGISFDFKYRSCYFSYADGDNTSLYNIPDTNIIEKGSIYSDFGVIDFTAIPLYIQNLSNLTLFEVSEIDRYLVNINSATFIQTISNGATNYNSSDYTFNFSYLLDGITYDESNIVSGTSYVPSCDFIINEETKTIDFTFNFISEIIFKSSECSVDYSSLINDFTNKGELPAEYDVYAYSWGGETLNDDFQLVNTNGTFLVGKNSTMCEFILVEKGVEASRDNAIYTSDIYSIVDNIVMVNADA